MTPLPRWLQDKRWDSLMGPCEIWLNFKSVIFKSILEIAIMSIWCKTYLSQMPQNTIGDRSMLVQVMAWCRQATSHYLSQCWLRSMSPYCITRPQWIKMLKHFLFFFVMLSDCLIYSNSNSTITLMRYCSLKLHTSWYWSVHLLPFRNPHD